MMCCSTLQVIDKALLFSTQQRSSLSQFQSSALFRWGFQTGQDTVRISRRTRSQAFQVMANPNMSSRKNSAKEVIMVDPSEAKKIAAKQMEKIKSKERFNRQREIEAINGAWAMIGLTAGLVVEGCTGDGILSQLAGYWAALVGIFLR